MKKVLISINKPHTDNIKAGVKKIEIRKDKPNISTPFPCLIYETKHKGGCGKVVGEFVCNKVYDFVQFGMGVAVAYNNEQLEPKTITKLACLSEREISEYLGNKDGFGWHISDLKIYEEPKELSEFRKPFKYNGDGLICGTSQEMSGIYEWDCESQFGEKYPDFSFENYDCENCPKAKDFYQITRPPQSWQYVEKQK